MARQAGGDLSPVPTLAGGGGVGWGGEGHHCHFGGAGEGELMFVVLDGCAGAVFRDGSGRFCGCFFFSFSF